MMHDFAKNGKKKRRIVQHDTAFYGLEGSRTLDLSDANRTLSQLSYRPIPDDPVSVTLFGKFVKYFGQGQKASLSGCLAARKQQRWQLPHLVNLLRGT